MSDYNPRTRYEHYYVRQARLEGRDELQHRYPDDFYVKPFRIAGNVYYIGNKAVCSHLIDTGAGLIVIDTSYPELDHLLINSIWEAGFDPKDIRIVLHTHLHYDHFGATNTLTKIYGAKAYVGRDEWESVQRKPELAVIPQDPYLSYRMIHPDVLLEDGDEICLGNTVIHCVETVGHTEGTMSFFFDVEDGGKVWRAGTFGGAGFITMYKEFFIRYGLPDLQPAFLHSLELMKQQNVQLVLGNHPGPNHILQKMEKLLNNPQGGNPFIDPTGQDWQNYLAWVEAEFKQFMADGR
mgnify:FL=1